MKSIIIAVLLASASFGASALNLQIPSPVKADRLSLVSEIEFNVDCRTQVVDVKRESNVFVARHIMKYIKQICYKDVNTYDITMKFGGGNNAWSERNMLATDAGRHIYKPVVVNYN